MPSHTIVAVFDTHAHADLAIADLTAAGVPASSIQHYTEETTSGITRTDTTLTGEKPAGGFWAWLTGEDEAASHHALYDRSIEHGHTVVTVIADDSNADHVSALLEEHAPLEINERDGEYAMSGGTPDATGAAYRTVTPGLENAAAPLGHDTFSGTRATAGDEVLSLSEEALQVGKKVVDAGVTRLRRYTVERPVEEQVRLRDESVNVFRRPVTGSATVGADAFTDKTIEMRQTTEQVVVGKTAHVVEEVGLKKDVREHVETVHETLRKEEVEVIGASGERLDGKSAAV